MDKEKEKIQIDKLESTSTTRRTEDNNECCKNNTNLGTTNGASDSTTPHLDTIIKMMKQLQIRSDFKPISANIFIDKLKESEEHKKHITTSYRYGGNETKSGAVLKLQYGFMLMKYHKPENSVNATKNGVTILPSTPNSLSTTKLLEVLEDKKVKSTTGPLIVATATPVSSSLGSNTNFSKYPTDRSAFKTSIPISNATEQLTTSNSAPIFLFGGLNTPFSVSTIFNPSSTSQSVLGTPTVATPSTSEDTASARSVFNKTVLMSMFDGPWNFGKATYENAVPIVTSPAVSSFPYRNIFASSTALSLKQLLSSQNKLKENSLKNNKTSCFVFGSQKTSASIVNRKPTPEKSTPENTGSGGSSFNKKAMFNGVSNFGFTYFKTIKPTFCMSLRYSASVYVFGGQLTLASIFKQNCTSQITIPSTSEQTTTAQNLFSRAASTSVFDCSTHEGILGISKSVSLNGKSPAQPEFARPSDNIQKVKIDVYKYEDYKSALAMLDDAIQLCPDNVTFYGVRCYYYMKHEMYKEAVKDAHKVIASNYNFTYGYFILAKCYIALGMSDAKDAISTARIVSDPSADEVQGVLQKLQQLLKLYNDMQHAVSASNYINAVAYTDQFLELCPSNKVKATKAKCLAMRAGDDANKIVQALKVAEECLRTDAYELEALYAKGLCYRLTVDYAKAHEYFLGALLIDPEHEAKSQINEIVLLRNATKLGDDLWSAGRWKEAMCEYKNAQRIDSGNVALQIRVHCKMAEIYLQSNLLNRAINEYTSALSFNKNCVKALHERAKCYSKSGNYWCAIRDYEKISETVESEDSKQSARNSIITLKEKHTYKKKCNQAKVLILRQKPNELEQGLQLAEECLQYDSSDTKALFVKGLCLYYKEQYKEALNQFQRVLSLDPKQSAAVEQTMKISRLECNINSGNDACIAGRWQEALDYFSEALEIDKDNRNLNLKLCSKKAEIYLKLNQIHRALTEYSNLLLLDSNHAEALRKRAKCYTDVHKYEDALKDYEMLYTIDKSDETKELLRKAKTAHNCLEAQEMAEAGKKLYRRNQFRNALSMYKDAIKLYPENAEYYSITCSCCINLSMFKEALVYAKKAVALYAKCSKGVGGIAKCYVALGDHFGAERAIIKATENGEDCTEDRRVLESLQRLHAQAQKYTEERNYDRAISCMDQCLKSSPFSYKVKLIKAECLTMLGNIEQALEIADECIRSDRFNIEALFVKGLCLYYDEKTEQALKYFKEVLRLSPDFKKASAAYKKAVLLEQKKGQGNEAFKMCQWQRALLLYNEALTVDPTHVNVNAKLNYNKAIVYMKLNKTEAVVDACTEALELKENYVRALNLRAQCFTKLEEHDCAVDDYERILKIDPSDAIKDLFNKAKESRKKQSRSNNYYSILGVSKTATAEDIVKAYRRLAKVHHPDRHPERERKRQNRLFQQISEAYTLLSDPIERRIYDKTGNVG